MSEDLTMKGLRGAAKAGDGYAKIVLAKLESREVKTRGKYLVFVVCADCLGEFWIPNDLVEEQLWCLYCKERLGCFKEGEG